ncbi:hypothetical protein H2200_008090 [Cladophialophora chaetospira]|uniref:Uncharacterized protein n=1 Tax=Cladophialophora chaetospira TaxID=386627 RepID=A0AA38X7F1_9EURO|nr:hypothetical protein H2200_008090 [Cladophialophora chaetospira]
MAPVPVHTASPLNTNVPSHAFGTSPSTAAARYTPYESETAAHPTSTRSLNGSPVQSAQPGARPAIPQPTNMAANASNSRLEPTPTAPIGSSTSDSPPPPQPGAVPLPPSNAPTRDSGPAPPRPFEIPTLPQAQTITRAPPLPMQSPSTYGTIYTPTRSVPPASTTCISTSPRPSYSSPYTLPHVPKIQDLSHPPGYQQDHHSSFDDKPIESCQETDYRATLSPLSASRRGAGILDLDWTFSSPNGSSNNSDTVVQTAMSWARAAGKRLSMTEKQVWKAINGGEDES